MYLVQCIGQLLRLQNIKKYIQDIGVGLHPSLYIHKFGLFHVTFDLAPETWRERN